MNILVDSQILVHVQEFCAKAQQQGHAVIEWDLTSKPNSGPSIVISGASNIIELNLMSRFPWIQGIHSVRVDQLSEDCKKLDLVLLQLSQAPEEIAPQGQINSFILDQTDKVNSAIKEFSQYVEGQNVFSHLGDIARTVASELLTNAFYNAPVDNEGKPLHSDRSKRVKLPSNKKVEFSYGDDGTHFWLSVRDSYGSFSRLGLLRNLIRCAQYEKLTVRQTGGGAGIGLFMVYCWAAQMRFHFTPGSQTFVHVKLLKTKRIKSFDSQKVSLEIVETPISARKVA